MKSINQGEADLLSYKLTAYHDEMIPYGEMPTLDIQWWYDIKKHSIILSVPTNISGADYILYAFHMKKNGYSMYKLEE